jgi:hypothetical protein
MTDAEFNILKGMVDELIKHAKTTGVEEVCRQRALTSNNGSLSSSYYALNKAEADLKRTYELIISILKKEVSPGFTGLTYKKAN